MSERDALRDEVRQEREQLVAAVQRLRSKVLIASGLRVVAGVARAVRAGSRRGRP